MGVSKNSGTPKWMVKIMENPLNKWMIWGENPLFVGNIHLCWPIVNGNSKGNQQNCQLFQQEIRLLLEGCCQILEDGVDIDRLLPSDSLVEPRNLTPEATRPCSLWGQCLCANQSRLWETKKRHFRSEEFKKRN